MTVDTKDNYARLHVLAAACTGGIIWALCVLLYTWWIMVRGMGETAEPNMLTRLYIGYHMTLSGSIIGMLWAFIDGFIICGAGALLYNKFVGMFARK